MRKKEIFPLSRPHSIIAVCTVIPILPNDCNINVGNIYYFMLYYENIQKKDNQALSAFAAGKCPLLDYPFSVYSRNIT